MVFGNLLKSKQTINLVTWKWPFPGWNAEAGQGYPSSAGRLSVAVSSDLPSQRRSDWKVIRLFGPLAFWLQLIYAKRKLQFGPFLVKRSI